MPSSDPVTLDVEDRDAFRPVIVHHTRCAESGSSAPPGLPLSLRHVHDQGHQPCSHGHAAGCWRSVAERTAPTSTLLMPGSRNNRAGGIETTRTGERRGNHRTRRAVEILSDRPAVQTVRTSATMSGMDRRSTLEGSPSRSRAPPSRPPWLPLLTISCAARPRSSSIGEAAGSLQGAPSQP
jgi:hypothetical protein